MFASPTRVLLTLVFLLATLGTGALSPAYADTYEWTGNGDMVSWSDPDNWQNRANGNPGVPGAGDTAVIGAGGAEVNSDRTVSRLELTGSLTITQGFTLTVNFLVLDSGGSIGGAGALDIDDEANFGGGTISVTVTLPADGTHNCGGSRLRIGSGTTFTNRGTLSGSCFVDLEAGTTIDNYGVIEEQIILSVDGALDNGVEEVTPYPVVNNKPGATMRTGTNAIFNNEGTVDVAPDRFATYSGGGTSSGTFIVAAEPSPNQGRDNARLTFEERFGVTPHDLTGATIQGGGTVSFEELRVPLTLTDATYDLSVAPYAQTRIDGADVTFPASITFGGLGQVLRLSDEDGRPGVLAVDHDVSVRELYMNSPSPLVDVIGGTGTLTVDSTLNVFYGLIRQKAVTIGPGVVPSGSNAARINTLDLADGATVVNEGVIGFERGGAQRIRLAEGTSWTNNGTLRIETGNDGDGIDTLGTPAARPVFTNNGTLRFIDTGTTSGVLGVDLVNAGTVRLGYGLGTVVAPQTRRGRVEVTGGFTNQSGAEIVGTGIFGWTNAAQITNDGRVAPGQPVAPTGLLEISGFTMSSTATLDLDVAGTLSSEGDLLRVRDAATLNGTLNVTLDDAPLGTYTLVGDNSSFPSVQISGTFAQVNVAPSGYTTRLAYPDNVTLEIAETAYPLLSLSRPDLDFGDSETGDVKTLEIENLGSGTLTLSDGALTGVDAGRFTVTAPSFPVDLAAGTTVDLQLQATGPETQQAVAAELVLSHNGSASGTATTTVSVSADQLVNPNFGEAAGYFFANTTFFAEDAPSQPQFDWVDVSSTGTDRIGDLADDSVIGPLPLGFTFRFFGQDYTEYWLSSNGWIAFVDPAGEDESFNERIPENNVPNGLVAWFWDDLNPAETAVSDRHLYTQTTTVNGRDAHVITFERYPEYRADADGWITGQVLLQPGADATTNGTIKLQYREHGASIDLEGATVGIENAAGSAGLQYRYNDRGGPLFGSPLAVQFGPDAGALPVELAGFEGRRADDRVRLTWQTASETNNAGFHVERAVAGGAFTALGFVEGRGTTDTPRAYRFVDGRLPYTADSLSYRLRQVDLDGTTAYSDEVVVRLGAPEGLVFEAPYPNPARGTVTLNYALATAADVTVGVYNVLGQQVAVLTQRPERAGRVERRVDLGRLSNGVYFVRLTASGETRTRRLVVVR